MLNLAYCCAKERGYVPKIYRYNIGSAFIKVSFFKMYFGFLFAGFWFTNLVTLLRFMQVCVWKRVVEINEDLGFRIASLSVFSGSYMKSL